MNKAIILLVFSYFLIHLHVPIFATSCLQRVTELKKRTLRMLDSFHDKYFEIKEEGKDQESIQSSTIHDPEHHMGK